MLKLYKIWVDESRVTYGKYECAVVVAHNKEEAREIHPDGTHVWRELCWWKVNDVIADDGFVLHEQVAVPFEDMEITWVDDPTQVHVEKVGKAAKYLREGVLLASYVE